MGVSARNMLNAIADGEEDPEIQANFAQRTLKKKKEELELALKGYISSHQRLMLKTILKHIDFLSEQIEMLDSEVAERVSSHQEDIDLLDSIPGIARRMAEQILSEIGTDIRNQFPSAAHMCSWAGLDLGIMKVPGRGNQLKRKKETNT
ncbi:Transposase IS116/IS110/IS902 family protein [Litchfieldia salsa]|uniref:Transposase IS116/IS110/IS902 family protein n=1 Tax=Litchfieldia salsa TaxID=930152 RepID=A0A1H0X329_9BACI|nr:Transposase IS116/IS110/IS902 family protein [Litchfieldia salsa]